VALAKMSVISDRGASIDNAGILQRANRVDEAWFGETSSEIILAIDPSSSDRLTTVMQENNVHYTRLGTTGGARLTLGPITLDLSALRAALDRALELPDVAGDS
jgi:phosphoribosylformylglycinamidine (FGAM) synthase-like enzyme